MGGVAYEMNKEDKTTERFTEKNEKQAATTWSFDYMSYRKKWKAHSFDIRYMKGRRKRSMGDTKRKYCTISKRRNEVYHSISSLSNYVA